MKRTLKFIFGLYCLLPFALSFLLVIPLYFFIFTFSGPKKAPHRAHRVSRAWAAFLLKAFYIRLRIQNKSLLVPDQVYVFIGNHRSFLDVPAYALSCPHTFRFLSKAELAQIPLLGYVIKNLYITVKRSDKYDRHKSIEKMLASLQEGISVFLAPEGTRNSSEKPLLDFKDGAFRLAIASGLPLAVLVLHHTDRLLSPGRPLEVSPGTLYGEWLAPFETKDYDEKSLGLLKEKVRQEMEQVILRGPQSGHP